MARSSFGRKVLATLLGAAVVVSLSVPVSVWGVSSDAGQTAVAADRGGSEELTLAYNSESASLRSISDLITFNGGSLRMDAGDSSTKTNLRFGYTFSVPDGASFASCSWEYYVNPNDKRTFKAGNSLLLNDKTCISNLVISDVPQANYNTTVYVKAYISYVTADGTSVTVAENDYHECSVKQAAESTLEHPMANSSAKSYAQKIIDTCK